MPVFVALVSVNEGKLPKEVDVSFPSDLFAHSEYSLLEQSFSSASYNFFSFIHMLWGIKSVG